MTESENNNPNASRGRMKRRSLMLSIICPGLGEFYCRETARALLLLFVRIFALAFPAVYLYDSSVDAKIFWAGSLSLIAATHFYSVIYFALRNSFEMDDLNIRYRGFPSCMGFFLLHWILVLAAAVLFATFIRVVRLTNDEGYPLYRAGDYVLVSARAPQQYHDGELVMTCTGDVERIICSDEGAIMEYSAGKIFINDVAVEQTAKTADELRAAGIAPDEEIYAEKFLGTYYLVSKKNDDKVEKKKYVIGKNELMLCPDNRKDFQPSIVSRDLLLGRVEGKPPLVNESVRVLERMKK